MKTLHTRTIALLTGGALASSLFLSPAPARADKAKNLKIGALVLGAIGVVSAIKGKELPAAVAAAGAYYAYKKSKDAKNDRYSNNNDYYPGDVYGDNSGYDNGSYDSYPTDNGNYSNRGRNGGYNNGGYTNYPSDNGGYNTYPTTSNNGGYTASCPDDNNTPYYGNADDGPYNDRHQRGYSNRNDRRADNSSLQTYFPAVR